MPGNPRRRPDATDRRTELAKVLAGASGRPSPTVGDLTAADAAIQAGWVSLIDGVDLDDAVPLLTEILESRIQQPQWRGYGSPAKDAAEAIVAVLKGMVE